MNKVEALIVLREHMERWRSRSYAELAALVDREPETFEQTGPTATCYQLEIRATWDDAPHRDVRVIGLIDDGGWRAFVPLGESFIVAPDGSFVGE